MARTNKIVGFKINKASIKKKIANSEEFKKAADWHAKRRFNKEKRRLLEEFTSHPVTLEIGGGAESKNLSGTLSDYGNLFTFIGFPAGVNPTELVRNFLISAVKMKRVPSKGDLNVNYKITIPSLSDFSVAKMPWEGGANWVQSVEVGVSGLNYFMSKASGVSRSGKGIQIDNKLRSLGKSANIKYMSKIINDFKLRITRK
jgi:hypothetical protein